MDLLDFVIFTGGTIMVFAVGAILAESHIVRRLARALAEVE